MPKLENVETLHTPTVEELVKHVAVQIAEIPTNSTQSDMAKALSQIADVEKAARKLKVALTASLVLAARQMSL